MCDPATLTALTIASGATSLVGGIQSAKSQQAALRYQSQLDEINAVNQDRAARDALERGELDALEHGRKVAALRAKQLNSAAAQGLDVGFGTPLELQIETDLLAAEDRGAIYENANREAESYRINASNYRASAAGAQAQSANVGTAMILDSASTVLNTATQLGGQWKKYGKPSFLSKKG